MERLPLPAKWIFVSAAVITCIVATTCILSPSLRFSLVTGWEVRSLLRFRARFKPENFEENCPNYRLYQAGACVRDLITEEHRLQYVSMTGRIYYLATMVSATETARENAHTVQDQVEAILNLLEYMNDEMKIVLLRTGGEVDLSPLDSRSTGSGLIEDPEVPLRRRYYANLVDLWIKTWRRDERTLTQSRSRIDARTRSRVDVLRADRDELFSRFSLDLSRYSKKRLPAGSSEAAEEAPPPPPHPAAGSGVVTVPPPHPSTVHAADASSSASTNSTSDPAETNDDPSGNSDVDAAPEVIYTDNPEASTPSRQLSSEPDPVPTTESSPSN